MYLIAGFDVLYFSRFKIKTNPSFMVYSFLEKISTKWNAHILASPQNKICLLQTLMQTIMQTFYILFIFW